MKAMKVYKEYTFTMLKDGQKITLTFSSINYLDASRQAEAHASVSGGIIIG